MNRTYSYSQSPCATIYSSRVIRRVPVGHKHYLISYGDKISVRLVTGENKIMDYQTDQVADMTDLTGDLRRRAKDTCGLAVAYIRNHDRGWTREHRIMLYPQRKFISRKKKDTAQQLISFPYEL